VRSWVLGIACSLVATFLVRALVTLLVSGAAAGGADVDSGVLPRRDSLWGAPLLPKRVPDGDGAVDLEKVATDRPTTDFVWMVRAPPGEWVCRCSADGAAADACERGVQKSALGAEHRKVATAS
jgi:hypothetical protein